MKSTNPKFLPVFACLSGISLPVDLFHLSEGVTLNSGVFEVFSTTMMAFKEAAPNKPTPIPWVAVNTGGKFQCRVQLNIETSDILEDLPPDRFAWLVATVLRMQIEAPIRLVAMANMPLVDLVDNSKDRAQAVEVSTKQFGIFRSSNEMLTVEQLEDLKRMIPLTVSMLENPEFDRALRIFDTALWASNAETASLLIWTSMEILMGVSSSRQKTKALSKSVSDWIALNTNDRDKAYNVVKDLYQKRGGIVHAGRDLEGQDFLQLFAIARSVIVNTINRKQLPNR